MTLAQKSDVEDRLGRALTSAEDAVVEARLTDAELLIFGWCGQSFDTFDTCADTIIAVEAGMVARVLLQGSAGQTPGIQSVQLGAFSTQYASALTTGDVWLSAGDKLRLRSCRRGGGMTSVQLVGERYEIEEDESSSSSA